MPCRICECLWLATHIGVPIQPTRQRHIGAGELPQRRVVVACAVVVEAGGSIGMLASEAIVGGHSAVAVARAAVRRVELAGRRRPAGVEGYCGAAQQIAGKVAQCAVDRQGDPLSSGIVVRCRGGRTTSRGNGFEGTRINGRRGRSAGRRLLLDAVALAVVEICIRATRRVLP
jgi:hypothetical protein